MSQHQVLVDWLTRAALRLRVDRRLRELGWGASALLGLLVVRLLLRAAPLPAAVDAALVPLLVLAALAAVTACCFRLMRPIDIAQAASRADASAGLHDELKSACWFAKQQDPSAAVTIMLQHAGRTVQRLDPDKLFPLSVPRSALAALVLAAAAAVLAHLPAGSADARSARGAEAAAHDSAVAARSASRTRLVGADQTDRFAAPLQDPASSQSRDDEALWARAEEAAERLDRVEDRDALRHAIQDRDTKRVTQLLEAAQPTSALPGGRAAQPEGNKISAEVAQGILERLQELLAQDDDTPGNDVKQSAEEGSLRVSPAQTAATQESQRADSARHDAESELNAALRAMSLAGTGDREAMRGRGEAQGWQEGDSSNANGGAMGRRVGLSRAGAGNGDAPPGHPAGDPEAAPVLGKQTLRLAAQLQRVATGSPSNERDDGAPEAFYAATQAQSSRLESQSVTGATRRTGEAALERAPTPLAYRSAVKKYFLTEHQKAN
jgi:hypothetical protein